MLNRRHIRIKVLQALYAYWSAGGEINKLYIEREMEKNLNRLYELYLFILLFVRELASFAEKYDDEVKGRNLHTSMELNVNKKFYENLIVKKLESNKDFEQQMKIYKVVWDDDNDILRKIFIDLKNSEIYREYITIVEDDKGTNLELFDFIIKHYPNSFSLFEQHLEEKFLNWYDDSKVVEQMVKKTFKNIVTDPESEEFLVPIALNEEVSFDFASELFNKVIEHSKDFETMIVTKIDKWEPTRLPLIDSIILKMGLAEFLYFSSIPVKVTINEYIELAKNYSTPNSKKFINGVLDNLLIELEKENKINKSGLGLA